MVGEMGESHHAIRMMGEYTTGKRLHQCYSFEMLGDVSTPAHFRGQIEEFYSGAPGGWPTWAFSNHDVRPPRHPLGEIRQRSPAAGQARRRAAAALRRLDLHLSGRGARPDRDRARVLRADRPAGPALLAREQGARRLPHADGLGRRQRQRGFSTGRPWLPVKAPQAANDVAGQLGRPNSVLEFYREMIRLRRDTEELRTGRTAFFDVSEPVLAFTRGGSVLCIFNLSPETHQVRARSVAGAFALAQGVEHHGGGTMTLHPNGFAIMEATAKAEVGDVPATASKQRATGRERCLILLGTIFGALSPPQGRLTASGEVEARRPEVAERFAGQCSGSRRNPRLPRRGRGSAGRGRRCR